MQRYYAECDAALYSTAAVLGGILPQPGIKLWLLERQDCGAAWTLFDIVGKENVAQDACVKLNDGSVSLEGFEPSLCPLMSFHF